MKKVQDHGYRIAEVPVHHFHRSYGKSQFFNFPRVGRTLADLARLWVELVVKRLHKVPGSEHAPLPSQAQQGVEKPRWPSPRTAEGETDRGASR
jgi:hypothetical protein